MTRYIGGSLLPSSDARILAPMGDFQVKPLPELDTHGLFHQGRLIASHPNGYSCHELAKRIMAGELDRALAQHDFILSCGGLAIKADRIANLMDAEEREK